MTKQRPLRSLPLRFRNQLRGAQDSYGALSTLRRIVTDSQIAPLLAWLPFAARSEPVLHRRTNSDGFFWLGKGRLLLPVSLGRELHWATLLLRRQANQLNGFLRLSTSFEEAFIISDHDSCKAILDEIEELYGCSLWGINRRLALLSQEGGLEAQKRYSADVQRGSRGGFAGFYAYHISRKFEENVNPIRFESEFRDMTSKWTADSDFRSYVNFIVTGEFPTQSSDQSGTLRYLQLASTIDLYEGFMQLAMGAYASRSKLLLEHLPKQIEGMAPEIDDFRLRRMLYLSTKHPELLQTSDFDLASCEDWLLTSSNTSLGPVASCYGVLSDLQSGAFSEPVTYSSRLLKTLRNLYGKDSATDALPFAIDLFKRLQLLEGSSFSASVIDFVDNQTSSEAVQSAASWTEIFVASRHVDAALLWFPGADVSEFVQPIAAVPGMSGVVDRVPASWNGFKASSWQRAYLEVAHALAQANFSIVVELTSSEMPPAPAYMQRVFARARAAAMLERTPLIDAIDYIVKVCLGALGAERMMPLAECVERLDKRALRNLRDRIVIPILYDLYTRFHDDQFNDLRGYTYEDFLIAHEVERPSQLRGVENQLDRALLIYYLRFVCVPEVMQVSTAFQSSSELEEERLSICEFLQELDPVNKDAYETEVRTITRKQVIQSGVRVVEQSKISIDVEPLRRWAERNPVSDGFTRLRGLLAAGQRADAPSIEASLGALYSVSSSVPALGDLPTNEVSHLLVQLVTVFLNQCFTHPYHGLDCYLSMRIRHGVLMGQMRAPLEDEHLLTQKSSVTGQYSRNDYWLARLNTLDTSAAERVDARLRKFSGDFDSLISSFVNDRIQIKSDDKPLGLFETQVPFEAIVVLSKDINEATSFASFIDQAIEVFWNVAKQDLQRVQTFIDADLSPRVHALFLDLVTSVDELTEGFDSAEIKNAVRASQTKAQHAIQATKDWFQTAQAATPSQFTFEELAHIGLEQIKRLRREFFPVVEVLSEGLPRYTQLVRFSDIFYLIFGNVARHSQLREPKVVIEAKQEGGAMTVSAASEVELAVWSPTIEQRLSGIRDKIARGEETAAGRIEGGSGLMKLRSRLGSGNGPALQFGFNGAQEFRVSMTIDLTESVGEMNDV